MTNDTETKPFLEHLDDLRWVLVRSAFALVIGIALCLALTKPLIDFLEWPLRRAGQNPELMAVVLHPADPFFIQMQVSLMGGIVLSLPYILYQISTFILPALTPQEKRYLAPVFAAGAVLFLAGLSFCYFIVLPETFAFFVEYNKWMGVTAMWTLQNYIDFCVQMLIGLGLAFEFPLVLITLNVLGILSHDTLATYRRHAIVVVVVLAACITPSTDFFSLSIVGVPLYAMYEICIWLTWGIEKRRRKPDLPAVTDDPYPR